MAAILCLWGDTERGVLRVVKGSFSSFKEEKKVLVVLNRAGLVIEDDKFNFMKLQQFSMAGFEFEQGGEKPRLRIFFSASG